MSAIATLVAFDGASTPVSRSFLAESVARDGQTVKATYKESTAGVPDYAQARVMITRTKTPSGVNKVVTRVEQPVMEAVNGQNAAGYTAAPKVAYIDTVEVVGLFHERSLLAGRRLVRQLAVNIANGVTTTVTPTTTGPLPEAFDQLIMPT